jgi:hypothetical protein
MKADPEYLKRHYASVSDEGLLDIDRETLTEDARNITTRKLRREDCWFLGKTFQMSVQARINNQRGTWISQGGFETPPKFTREPWSPARILKTPRMLATLWTPRESPVIWK